MHFEKMAFVEYALIKKIDDFTKNELEQILEECEKLTTENCSWVKYHLKYIVTRLVKSRLRWIES